MQKNGITEADKELAVANAAVAVADAQAGYDSALAAQNDAQAKLETAQAELTSAEAAYQELNDACREQNQKMQEAWANKEALNKSIEELKGSIDRIAKDMEAQVSILQGLKAKQAEAETAYTKAQDALKAAEAEKVNAETSVKEAELKVEQAKQDAQTAQEKIKEGSLGFFAELGCQKAIDRIKEYSSGKYAQYWMFGDERDATSLENMKEALEYIKYCQQMLREEQANGNINTNYPGDFKVSLDQIAAAQVGANISSVIRDHSHVVGDENLYWSDLKSPENAYDAWYWTEKEMYENGETDPSKIGHYTNLRDSANNYSVIGIAVHDRVMNEDGTFKNYSTVSQTFNTTEVTGDGEENFVFSVDRYEELFMKYYNDLHAQLNGEEAAKKALEEAKAGLADAVKVVDAASKTATTAKDNLDAATLDVDCQQDTVDGIQSILDEMNQELAQKQQEAAKAEEDFQKLSTEMYELNEQAQAAERYMNSRKTAVAYAEKVLDEKQIPKQKAFFWMRLQMLTRN